MFYSIAIDGPAGAGKSTIARRAAKKLGFIYVDTGAMYRAIALFLLRSNITADDICAVEAACDNISVAIEYKNGEQQVLLNGENVSRLIRTEEVGKMASNSSKIQRVRECLLNLQREQAKHASVIMDGRDIGTVVLPKATVKIFLTADAEIRAERRYKELVEKGTACSLEEILHDIRERDKTDMTRANAPLVRAKDAILLDSSKMSIDEVADKIVALFKEAEKI